MVRPYKKINMNWSGKLAYVIGIITTDGNLSPDGRHISITSKDREIVDNCKSALEIDNKIGRKARGGETEKKYFVLQFGSVIFYKFLLDIGLHPNKSKTIKSVNVPDKYFADFLRGCIDGDGSIISFSHPESIHPQLRLRLTSASSNFLTWIKYSIQENTNITRGWIQANKKNGIYNVSVLAYGISDSIKLLKYMYNTDCQYKLTRKYNTAKKYIKLIK